MSLSHSSIDNSSDIYIGEIRLFPSTASLPNIWAECRPGQRLRTDENLPLAYLLHKASGNEIWTIDSSPFTTHFTLPVLKGPRDEIRNRIGIFRHYIALRGKFPGKIEDLSDWVNFILEDVRE